MFGIRPGYRNVFLILTFLLWVVGMSFVFSPPDHKWTPELIASFGTFCTEVGVAFVLSILGRAANKYVDGKNGSPTPRE